MKYGLWVDIKVLYQHLKETLKALELQGTEKVVSSNFEINNYYI